MWIARSLKVIGIAKTTDHIFAGEPRNSAFFVLVLSTVCALLINLSTFSPNFGLFMENFCVGKRSMFMFSLNKVMVSKSVRVVIVQESGQSTEMLQNNLLELRTDNRFLNKIEHHCKSFWSPGLEEHKKMQNCVGRTLSLGETKHWIWSTVSYSLQPSMQPLAKTCVSSLCNYSKCITTCSFREKWQEPKPTTVNGRHGSPFLAILNQASVRRGCVEWGGRVGRLDPAHFDAL